MGAEGDTVGAATEVAEVATGCEDTAVTLGVEDATTATEGAAVMGAGPAQEDAVLVDVPDAEAET